MSKYSNLRALLCTAIVCNIYNVVIERHRYLIAPCKHCLYTLLQSIECNYTQWQSIEYFYTSRNRLSFFIFTAVIGKVPAILTLRVRDTAKMSIAGRYIFRSYHFQILSQTDYALFIKFWNLGNWGKRGGTYYVQCITSS